MKYTSRSVYLLLSGVFYLFFLGFFIYTFEKLFLNCPYPDFLSWDGNLRFITTLRMMDALRSGDWFSLTRQFLDAPTWPTFRNIFQMISFFIWEPNGTVDTNLTLFTFMILCICLPYFFFQLNTKKSSIIVILSSFFTLALLFHSDTILLYVFSTMLEIQGSLFTLLFLTSFYLFLVKRKSILYPSLFGFLCYQTKYPYGYILIFYITLFFIIFSRRESFTYLKDLFPFLLNKKTKIYFFLILIFLGISLLFKNQLPGKLPFYLNYLSILMFSLLSGKYILQLNKKKPSLFTQSLTYLILPIVIFTVLHPDRVGSSAGTIQHIQSEGKIVGEIIERDLSYYLSFFTTLYIDLWDNSYVGFFFLFLNFFSLSNGLILLIFKKKTTNPSFIFSSFIFISIIGLTILTPNHQARHVFHLYPLVIFSGFLFLTEKSFFQKWIVRVFCSYFFLNQNLKIFIKKHSTFRFFFYWVGIILLGILYAISSSEKLSIWNRNPHLCFGGKIPIYDTPLFFERELKNKLTQDSVLLNLIDPSHLNKVDTELIFAKAAYIQSKKVALNQREYLKNPNSFPILILAGTTCNYSLEDLEKQYLSKLVFKWERLSEKACLIFLEKQNL
jgi:hypothetical protein